MAGLEPPLEPPQCCPRSPKQALGTQPRPCPRGPQLPPMLCRGLLLGAGAKSHPGYQIPLQMGGMENPKQDRNGTNGALGTSTVWWDHGHTWDHDRVVASDLSGGTRTMCRTGAGTMMGPGSCGWTRTVWWHEYHEMGPGASVGPKPSGETRPCGATGPGQSDQTRTPCRTKTT